MFISDLFQLDKLKVEWVPSADRVPDSAWEKLFPAPFEGGWWYETIENSDLQEQFKFLYAVVRRNKEIVALAPAFLMDVPISLVIPDLVLDVANAVATVFPQLRHQRTLFLGSPCADEGRVGIVSRQDELSVLLALHNAAEIKAKQEKAQMVVWKDFPDSYKPSFQSLCRSKSLFAMPSFPSTVLELQDGKMDTYFENLKGSRRHNLKKKLRKSKSLIDLATEVIECPGDEDMEKIFKLFRQTYEKGKTKFEELNIKFFKLIAAQPCSCFIVLRERSTREPVAFMLCFKLGDKIINKFIGIDYHRPAEYFLYFRLWEAALDWVLAQGAREFQSGQTGYRAKIDVGHHLVPLTNYCKHFNPLVQTVFRQGARFVSWSTLDEDLKTYLAAHPDAEQNSDEKTEPQPKEALTKDATASNKEESNSSTGNESEASIASESSDTANESSKRTTTINAAPLCEVPISP